ncbi:MAG: hypothetical protein IKV45_06290 [Firmicutes bacterium]|nr:hypothetical protein [Bacillota bacterium]
MEIKMVQPELIPFTFSDVLRSLGMPSAHRFSEPIGALLEKTKDIASPKAFYLECPIEQRTEKMVFAGGQRFYSDRLSQNTKHSAVLYPFLCTCGKEMADFAESLSDVAEVFAFDAIMEFYRKLMTFQVKETIRRELPYGLVPRVDYPGDLWGWEIHDLKKLFRIFGDHAWEIGVSLSEFYMMTPLKTVAGVIYGEPETETECPLCSLERCSRREAPFSQVACLESLYRI